MIEENDWGLNWMQTPWIVWGLVPFLAVNIGFWGTAIPLELILNKLMQDDSSFWNKWFHLIEYGNQKNRRQELAECRAQISLAHQAKVSLMQMCGPTAIIGAVTAGYLLPLWMPAVERTMPTLAQFTLQMIIMEIVGDFSLYWGHRVQHSSQYLWENFHSKHHQLGTPSALSAACIDGIDATLQASIPMLLAGLSARAHPVSFWGHCFFRVSQNVVHHCGMTSPLLSILFFKYLPGRADNNFHDYHHRYSNYQGQARNYGEYFTLWDELFGTASNLDKLKMK
ncbi:Methylsterol monooxygenase 2 [Seminavis robusta]|uniref:Methylsterol monooxygenase 2 n=1 Tax=Seminavis robusta TaxID=568900 RepID=A0A9N8ESV9_9STRA|nr:Methylsterol monooxygenase 2 [Seminavis robusta]|eukprot:Sro1542_g281040.1 Methylsterol monooxygenase 2 (282) ;mRNA; f:10248-11093